MKNVKTVSIMMIITMVLIVIGFAMLIMRKQTVTLNGETSELKSFWGKNKTPLLKTDSKSPAYEGE